MPSLDFERPDNEPKAESWESLQHALGSSDVNFNEAQLQKTAGGSMEQATRAMTGTLWAGSATINEQYELECHMKEMIEEGRVFPAIEKSLKAYGYTKDKIRRVFQKLTNIDPVQAYLDTSTYTIPPDAVPRYNYGWGPSKDKKSDYHFILPFIEKFAVYKQTGLEREIVFDHLSLEATREELRKYVKDVRFVTPDSLDSDSDIIQRVASLQVPLFDSEQANKLAAEVCRLKTLGEPDDARRMVLNAEQEGVLSTAELGQMLLYVEAEDPSEMTGQDKERNREVDKYQKAQEGRSIGDEIQTLKIPQNEFAEKMQNDNRVNMKELSGDAYDLLTEIAATIPGYAVEPVGQTVDLLDVKSYTADDSNHIDTGAVRFMVIMSDLKTQQTRKGLVIMFIVNGKLQYSGKFKGEDNREYALSSPGVNNYFDSLEGKSVEELHYTPPAAPAWDASTPYKY